LRTMAGHASEPGDGRNPETHQEPLRSRQGAIFGVAAGLGRDTVTMTMVVPNPRTDNFLAGH